MIIIIIIIIIHYCYMHTFELVSLNYHHFLRSKIIEIITVLSLYKSVFLFSINI